MPKGIGEIPSLRLEVLQNFVTKFQGPANLALMNIFGQSDSPSDTIRWESQEGGRGMAQLKAPGAPTPKSAPEGMAEHSAKAAFWGDKRYFDEEFLNNLRKPGTESGYMEASQTLATNLATMIRRCERRKEWFFSKMFTSGSFTYERAQGVKATVNYAIPTTHKVGLTTDYKWGTGTKANILGDVMDCKGLIADDCGGQVDYMMFNRTVLRYIAANSSILDLLKKSNYGDGDLFKGNRNSIVGVNTNVLGSLLDIPNLIVYDELYEVKEFLTGAVTGSSTTVIPVRDAGDFVAAGVLRFYDSSEGTWEEETITSVQVEAGTVTVGTAPTASFKAGEDYVTMKRKYIPDNMVVFFTSTVDGEKIAEFKRAPFGLDRHYGIKTDTKETWDPDGINLRVQDKGLPVLYHRDGLYILTVE